MAYTQAHNKANQKYQVKAYDRLYIRVKKGKKEDYAKAAENNGESLAGMITRLLDTEAETVAARVQSAAASAGKDTGEYIHDAIDRQMHLDETGENEIDGKVLNNLIDWLKDHGHTPEEVTDCLSALSK